MGKVVANVFWNADGTLSLDYLLTFTNQPWRSRHRVRRRGTSHHAFNINDIQADFNGSPLQDCPATSRGLPGMAWLWIWAGCDPAGGAGTIHVRADNIPRLLYTDDDDSNYASAAFAPLYLQGDVIRGNTDMTVMFHLPPGVTFSPI